MESRLPSLLFMERRFSNRRLFVGAMCRIYRPRRDAETAEVLRGLLLAFRPKSIRCHVERTEEQRNRLFITRAPSCILSICASVKDTRTYIFIFDRSPGATGEFYFKT